jgi:nitrogen-specific signal transduction histidine kinase/ActR/RegA family two-component response regulator
LSEHLPLHTILPGENRQRRKKKKLEEQLRHAQRLESIGILAGGVAHDFNNILNVISGFGGMMDMKLAPDDPNKGYIHEILAAADRAAELTRSLLIFSRKQITEQKPININDLIKGMQKMIQRIIGEDIETHIERAPNNLIVVGDYGQLEQVVMNLATNARDAMPMGGSLLIETKMQEIDAEFNREHGFGKPGRYAVISVTDSGRGMDEETREKIFEPFFTTKEVGKGTGLGLSIVYGIVKQHSGYIDCYIKPGSGTTFMVYLPLIESNVHGEEELSSAVLQGGTETILLAEDDPASRSISKQLLERFGYTVIAAENGAEAVNKFIENMEAIDLLLFDVIMPVKSGSAAFEEIKGMRPDIKVLFVSGYTDDSVQRMIVVDGKHLLLHKPVKPAELLSKIRAVLDGKT